MTNDNDSVTEKEAAMCESATRLGWNATRSCGPKPQSLTCDPRAPRLCSHSDWHSICGEAKMREGDKGLIQRAQGNRTGPPKNCIK